MRTTQYIHPGTLLEPAALKCVVKQVLITLDNPSPRKAVNGKTVYLRRQFEVAKVIENPLIFELLGPNIPDTINTHFSSGRLAKAIAKQALIELDDLHQGGIGHGGGMPIDMSFLGFPEMS